VQLLGTIPGRTLVIWTSSMMVDMTALNGGMVIEELIEPSKDKTKNHVVSKTGNQFLALRLASKVSPKEW
jgi:hypothetical protein